MDCKVYNKSLDLLGELMVHFANAGEDELAEKVCSLVVDCDQNCYEIMLILANSDSSETVSRENVIEFRKSIAEESRHTASTSPRMLQ